MEKDKYYFREQECADVFNRLGTVFNANTPERHPTIFNTTEDYVAGMSIFGISAMMFPKMRIFAFQLMSNHIHMVVSGDKDYIKEFFSYFKERLDRHFNSQVDLSSFELTCFPVNDLAYFRNGIAYTNRNGFVVCDCFTPFSYPWGTSPYFFQPMVKQYVRISAKPATVAWMRKVMHTHDLDICKKAFIVDGYIPPLSFCDIQTAEAVFRNAKQYFHDIARKVEAYASIAKSIGESVYFTDIDIYNIASQIAKDDYGAKDLTSLDAKHKIELARRLRFDYNAGGKQIQRMLKINDDVLKALF